MHPTITISSFLVFAAVVSLGGNAQLFSGVIAVVLICFYTRTFPNRDNLSSLWRLRWLFLSIALIYLSSTPGQPLYEQYEFLTREGVLLALQRCLILVLLLLSIQMLLRRLDQQQLLQGLYWLLYPVKFLGLDHQRLVLRLALTLELAQTQNLNHFRKGEPEQTLTIKQRIVVLAERLCSVFNEAATGNTQKTTIEFELISAPALWMWLFPVLLGIMLNAMEYI